MADALDALARGELTFTPQREAGVTYAQKIDKAEARIDWRATGARVAQSRARPVAFSGRLFRGDLGHGVERVKVLRTRVEDGRGRAGNERSTTRGSSPAARARCVCCGCSGPARGAMASSDEFRREAGRSIERDDSLRS